MKTLLYNATIVSHEEEFWGALVIEGEFISEIWHAGENGIFKRGECEKTLEEILALADESVDMQGYSLMAGAIDAHVHFREPGLTHKADIASESRAALIGGVTSYIDMPNTSPATTSAEALQGKLALAEGRSYSNYGFHIGVTNDNVPAIAAMVGPGRLFAGVKVFMGSSTGNMLVDRGDALEAAFGLKDVEILIHSEDENMIKAGLEMAKATYPDGDVPFNMHPLIRSRQACVKSTIKALEMAMRLGTHLHVCHVSTREEVEMVRAAKIHNPFITAETSANYLWFSDGDYESAKGKVKCNPAIKTADDRDALLKALKEGLIDTIGSDHAPHLLSEKDKPYLQCPSGLPSIGESLPAMITIARREGVGLPALSMMMSANPAAIFGIDRRGRIEEGYYADIVAVDLNSSVTVSSEDAPGCIRPQYKCGWSPYEGCTFNCRIADVYLNGVPAVHDGRLISGAPHGKPLKYS